MLKAFAFALPLLFLAASCTYDNGDSNEVLYGRGSVTSLNGLACAADVQSNIDTDRMIDVDAGQGAGLFLEYASGGHWQVSTSCDTLRTNTTCAWDIIVTPQDGSSLSNVTPTNLEPSDSLAAYDATSYQLYTNTGTDLDGFSFDSDPGAAVRVDALLDGSCATQFFYWVGDGALHSGSPTNPIDLVPSAN